MRYAILFLVLNLPCLVIAKGKPIDFTQLTFSKAGKSTVVATTKDDVVFKTDEFGWAWAEVDFKKSLKATFTIHAIKGMEYTNFQIFFGNKKSKRQVGVGLHTLEKEMLLTEQVTVHDKKQTLPLDTDEVRPGEAIEVTLRIKALNNTATLSVGKDSITMKLQEKLGSIDQIGFRSFKRGARITDLRVSQF